VTKLLATIAFGAASLWLVVPSAAAQSPSDREIAKAGVFHADDFPAGWRATPPKKSDADPNACPALRRAVGSSRKNRTAKAASDDFERQNDRYSSNVAVARTDDLARRAYKAAASRDMRRCITRIFKEEIKKSTKGYDVKVEGGTVTGSGSYGDESSDIGFKITLSKEPLNQEVFADFVFVRVGRAIGLYLRVSTSESSEFDTPTFDGLITSATGRLTAATGGQPTTATT
jgi:hypothetical protein